MAEMDEQGISTKNQNSSQQGQAAAGKQVEYTNNGAFVVSMEGVTDEKEHFFSVEGLSIEYGICAQYFGGDTYSYYLPGNIQNSPIYFKRPVTNVKSGLTTWCCDALENSIIKPTDINIFIMSNGDIINQWLAEKAIPIGMSISAMDVQSDSVLIEVLTLMYQKLSRVK